MSSKYKAFFIAQVGALFGFFIYQRLGFLVSWDEQLGVTPSLLSLVLSVGAGLIVNTIFQKYELQKSIQNSLLSWFFIILSIFGLNHIGIAVPVASLTHSFLWSVVGLIFYQATFEKNQKEFLKSAFKQYVSPQLVESIARHPEKLGLKGEKRQLSILFSDLEGFTKIAEKIGADELVKFMNEYFTGISEIIFRYGGTVDKFIGDAVMAFWNAPIENQEHAELAVQCAYEMSDFSKDFIKSKSTLIKELQSGTRTRIGINTGLSIVGNIGSELRFSYTVMGDEVNLASRIEPLNQHYGTHLLASGATRGLCQNQLRHSKKTEDILIFRFVDRVKVKGRDRATDLYTLVKKSQENEHLINLYEAAHQLYSKGEFQQASLQFSSLLNEYPNDTISQVLRDRSQRFLSLKIENWSGVFEFENK